MTQILYSYSLEENHNRLLQEFLLDFPKDFQKKILRYTHWKDAQLSLIGRLLLRHGLKKINKCYQEKELKYTEYNKPYLFNSEVKFNISHSGNIVVCAITNNNHIGIDIEEICDININDFRSQMTEFEFQYIMNSNNYKIAFYNYWTQKEAVIKANGMGLSLSLKSFEIFDGHTFIEGEDFFLKEIKLDIDYKCHLAYKNRPDSIILSPYKVIF